MSYVLKMKVLMWKSKLILVPSTPGTHGCKWCGLHLCIVLEHLSVLLSQIELKHCKKLESWCPLFDNS